MAYHLPRVIYWAQQKSVAFFATPYLAQLQLQPFAEYFMLHSCLVSGGDRLVNLVQWFGCLTSVIGVSLIARHFGAAARGQLLAALFCVTLPNGILQATGAKNDYLMAAWLVAAVWFIARKEAVWAGLAIGLAIGTKATAYLFLPALVLLLWRMNWKRTAVAAACALALNVPQYVRNIDLSGSPLGFDSSQADGQFRFRNDRFGWKPAVSNLLRHTSEQMGARSERWNRWVYDRVAAAHSALGIDLNDPATTWRWTVFEPPRNPNHEANTPNKWHLLIVIVCAIHLVGRAFLPAAGLRRAEARRRPGRAAPQWYLTALFAGLLLFCFYLKWQPFQARLFLPLFVLASPVAGVVLERIRPAILQVALCIFLLNNTRPYLFENWVRPLRGPNSILRTPPDQAYFNDMSQWNNRAAYLATVDAAAASGCSLIGVDINAFQLEYPFEALVRQRNPAARFVHVNVTNPSRKYDRGEQPCFTARLPPHD